MSCCHAEWQPEGAPCTLDGVRVTTRAVGSAVHLEIVGIGTLMLTEPAAKALGAALMFESTRVLAGHLTRGVL